MPRLVAIDARDAYAQPLRGWGRYALELIRHLPQELDVREYREGGRGPEIVFEQLVLPLQAAPRAGGARALAQLLPAADAARARAS